MITRKLFFRRHFHQFLWFSVFACFVGVGLWNFKSAGSASKIDGAGPNCVIDGILRDMIWVRGASQQISEELGKLPSTGHRVVVFFPHANNNMAIIHEMVSYLCWPRETLSIPMDKKHLADSVTYLRRSPVSAMVFYCFVPPTPEKSKDIGLMRIVLLEQKPQ